MSTRVNSASANPSDRSLIKALQTKHLAGGRIQFTCRIEAISLLELAERLPGEGTVETIDWSGIEAGDQQALLETAHESTTRLAVVSRRRGRKRLGRRTRRGRGGFALVQPDGSRDQTCDEQ